MAAPAADLSIAAACDETGLSPRTVRYYEEVGLLRKRHRLLGAGDRGTRGELPLVRLPGTPGFGEGDRHQQVPAREAGKPTLLLRVAAG